MIFFTKITVRSVCALSLIFSSAVYAGDYEQQPRRKKVNIKIDLQEDFPVGFPDHGRKTQETADTKRSSILRVLTQEHNEQSNAQLEAARKKRFAQAQMPIVFHPRFVRRTQARGNSIVAVPVSDQTGTINTARIAALDLLYDLFPQNDTIEKFTHAHVTLLTIPSVYSDSEDEKDRLENFALDVAPYIYTLRQRLAEPLTMRIGGRLRLFGQSANMPCKRFIGIPVAGFNEHITQLVDYMHREIYPSFISTYPHISLASITLTTPEQNRMLEDAVAAQPDFLVADREDRVIEHIDFLHGRPVATYDL